MSFLVDTGADISILKIGTFCREVEVDQEEIVVIKGVASSKTISLGTVKGYVEIGGKLYYNKFHVVKGDFFMESDGMLGIDFLKEHKMNIVFEEKIIANQLILENKSDKVKKRQQHDLIQEKKNKLLEENKSGEIELVRKDSEKGLMELEENKFKENFHEQMNNLELENPIFQEEIDNSEQIELNINSRKVQQNNGINQIEIAIDQQGTEEFVHKERDNDIVQSVLNKESIEMGNCIQRNVSGNLANWLALRGVKERIIGEIETKELDCSGQLKMIDRHLEIESKISNGLNIEEKQILCKVLREYEDVFHLEGEPLTSCNVTFHEIPVNKEIKPINVKPYRLPITHREEIDRQVEEMLENGLIRYSKSAWNSPLLLVPKKSKDEAKKEWRLVVDYRKLNLITESDNFPIPNMTDILDQLGNAKYFSTLDLSAGYHQILLKESDREKTAFSTGYNHYEWCRMPMGLKSAGHTFQRIMNRVLSPVNGKEAFVYLDDIVIYSSTIEEHLQRLKKVLDCLRGSNLKLKPSKCNFFQESVIYLGHIITKDGIKPNPEKVLAIEKFPTPRTPKAIKSFLGMIGYYRKFIPNFSEISKPMLKLLKKGVKFIWSEETEKAFKDLKGKILESPILQYPDFTKPFRLTTDASTKAIAAVLSQMSDNNIDLPIAFASRSLLDAETKYSTTELELLAIVWAIEHFRVYLYGKKFQVVTDHRPLAWLMDLRDPSSRLMRWKIRLAHYDFTIEYIKGKLNHVADCLSRYIDEEVKHKIHVVTRAGKKKQEEDEYCEELLENPERSMIIESQDKNLYDKIKDRIQFISMENDRVLNFPDQTIEKGNLVIDQEGDTNRIYVITRDKEQDLHEVNAVKQGLEKFKTYVIEEKIKEISVNVSENIITYNNFRDIIEIMKDKLLDTSINIILFKKTAKLICKSSDIESVLKEFHDTPIGGHQGSNKMLAKISNQYQWVGMKKDIKDFVRRCEICQKNKYSKQTRVPMQITTTATRPMERIALDVVGPLPLTINGNKYLITYQDDLTKYVGAFPIPNQEAETIARAFVQNIILRFGMNGKMSILTDQGSNFESELLGNICKLLKIKKTRASAWHAATNGSLERSHRTMKEYLRTLINTNMNDWDDFMNFCIFNLNTSKNRATGYSPFELLHGYQAEIPTSVKTNNTRYNYDDYYYELKYKLQKSHQIAREKQLIEKLKTKEYYDKKASDLELNQGDKVLLLNTFKRGEGIKLQPLYLGPYSVEEIVSETNIKLKIGKKFKVVHKNLVKKFFE